VFPDDRFFAYNPQKLSQGFVGLLEIVEQENPKALVIAKEKRDPDHLVVNNKNIKLYAKESSKSKKGKHNGKIHYRRLHRPRYSRTIYLYKYTKNLLSIILIEKYSLITF
jgi:hypothetical protein